MNILITGGSGYIGSVLVEKLLTDLPDGSPYTLNEVPHVTVLDNLMYKQTTLTQHCHRNNFDFVHGDVRDKELLTALVADADVVIPLACIVGMPACTKNIHAAVAINQEHVQYIADIATTQKIIYPTTNSGYGVGQVEDGELVECTEVTPLNPISLYGKTKVNAENHILDQGNGICLRLATVFGMSPRMRLDLLVNDFAYRAYKDGFITLFESHFKRNYIHVRDIARTFIFCINNYAAMKGEAYNVGLSSANLNKMELCEKIKEYIPEFAINESEIGSDPDKRNYIVSNEKLESLGWSPSFSLESGIEELLMAYPIISNHNTLFTNL